MPELLYTLAVLACPVGMGLMMWMMNRGHGGGQAESPAEKQAESPAEKQAEISALRTEIDALRADREGSARPDAAEPSR